MLAHQLAQTVHAHILADPLPATPGAKAPPGVGAKISTLLGYLKWGVLVIIVGSGLVGAAAVAGGRAFAHHGSSKIGVAILMSSLGGAVLYAGIYAVLAELVK